MQKIMLLPLMTVFNFTAWASETNVKLSCTSINPTTQTACLLREPVLISTLTEKMEASWTIEYSFPCQGHRVGLGFDTGSKFVNLNYTNGSRPRIELTENGDGPLMFTDLDPVNTRRATLVGGCTLTVHSVRVTPSLHTLRDWEDDARDQAKIIGLSLAAYELARDFKSYAEWDVQQTTTLVNSARLKVQLFESLCEQSDETACRTAAHFRVVVGALEAKLIGSPAQPIGDETGGELVSAYEKDLEREVQMGRDMIARFQRWNAAVTQELETVVNSIQL